jgi:hypothetical protein
MAPAATRNLTILATGLLGYSFTRLGTLFF